MSGSTARRVTTSKATSHWGLDMCAILRPPTVRGCIPATELVDYPMLCYRDENIGSKDLVSPWSNSLVVTPRIRVAFHLYASASEIHQRPQPANRSMSSNVWAQSCVFQTIRETVHLTTREASMYGPLVTPLCY